MSYILFTNEAIMMLSLCTTVECWYKAKKERSIHFKEKTNNNTTISPAKESVIALCSFYYICTISLHVEIVFCLINLFIHIKFIYLFI